MLKTFAVIPSVVGGRSSDEWIGRWYSPVISAGVARSGVYRPLPAAANDDDDPALMRWIDEPFTTWPFLTSLRMATMLRAEGCAVIATVSKELPKGWLKAEQWLHGETAFMTCSRSRH
jgi:hypothetical protein